MLRRQIDDLENAIQSARNEQDGGRYTIKQIERTRKTLQVRLEKLNKKEKKIMWLRLKNLELTIYMWMKRTAIKMRFFIQK